MFFVYLALYWARVMEKDLPVALDDIENETYRNHVVKTG